MSDAYILAACRTPIGKFLGSLAGVTAPQLASIAIREALRRSGVDPEHVDEVIVGNVLSAGLGQAPARQAAMGGGIAASVPAVTVNKVCGSGLKAVMLADQAIRCGDARVIVAGGMESMSQAPHLLTGTRSGWKFGKRQVLDSLEQDGLWCTFERQGMGSAAEYIARTHGISRAAQDRFALTSHERAIAAIERGRFASEIVPVEVSAGGAIVDVDEGPRRDTSLERLASLRPSFDPEGTVTAGNASQMSDGAAALIVADEGIAERSSAPLKTRIVASAAAGVPPKEIFIAPVLAIEKVLKKAGLTIGDIELFELNEAFAAQCLACMGPLEIPHEKLNVDGGAIALGHPLGASGARVLTTLLYSMAERGAYRGLASLCLGGGNAVAMIVERVVS